MGRQVSNAKMEIVGICSISRCNNSRVVGSVQCKVFQDEQHRLMFGMFQEDGDNRFKGFCLDAVVRGSGEDSDVQGEAGEQRRKQWDRFLQGKSILAQHLLSFPISRQGFLSLEL